MIFVSQTNGFSQSTNKLLTKSYNILSESSIEKENPNITIHISMVYAEEIPITCLPYLTLRDNDRVIDFNATVHEIKMYFTSSPIASPASSIYSSYSMSSTSSSRDPRPQSPSCAYPSWPRRSSLDGGVTDEPTSFISDDDLFPDVFDDNDSDCTPVASPCRSPPQTTTREVEIISFTTIRQMLALQKQLEPEKKRKKRRSSSSSSRKSRSGHAKPMSPIQETGE
jgi:hypothetical protein